MSQIDVSTLLPWGKPREVQTRLGPRRLRKADPDEPFWALWRTQKLILKDLGVSVSKDLQTEKFQVCWWQKLDGEELAKREANLVMSRAADADIEIPTPPGCVFFPFQKAGVKFALNCFGYETPTKINTDQNQSRPNGDKTISGNPSQDVSGMHRNEGRDARQAPFGGNEAQNRDGSTRTEESQLQAKHVDSRQDASSRNQSKNESCMDSAQGGGCYIADDMGLGKTLQAIGVINCIPAIKRILVVTKASLKLNWFRELRKWLVREYSIGIAEAQYWPRKDNIIIINYDVLSRHMHKLREQPWDLVILDESANIKNRATKRTIAVIGQKPSRKKQEEEGAEVIPPIPAKRRLALSGTPIENRPEEIWPALHFLDPERWANFYGFAARYCGMDRSSGFLDTSGASNLDQLQNVLRQTCMIRRLKSEVLKELPPKTRQVIELEDEGLFGVVEREAVTLKRYEDVLAEAQANLEIAKASESDEAYRAAVQNMAQNNVALAQIAKVRQETAIAKIPLLIPILKEEIEEAGKILVFGHHRKVLHPLHDAFPGSILITGETPANERQFLCDRFQEDPGCSALFGSIRACGEGLTLTAARIVAFVEEDWSPGKMSQAEDRCILEGQPILTAEGWKPIEALKIGDMVIGSDSLPHRVMDAWSRQAKSYPHVDKRISEIKVQGWGTPLCMTEDHRILTKEGWREARTLQPGERIASIGFTKGRLIVSSVTLRAPKHDEKVYDLTVEHSETFVVGTAVVHNCHRIGQHDNVLVKHYVVPRSIDAEMLSYILEKQVMIERALNIDPSLWTGEPVFARFKALGSRREIQEEGLLMTSFEVYGAEKALESIPELPTKVEMFLAQKLAALRPLTQPQAALVKRLCKRYRELWDPALLEGVGIEETSVIDRI